MCREEFVVVETINYTRILYIFCLVLQRLTSAGVEVRIHPKLLAERRESDRQTSVLVITGLFKNVSVLGFMVCANKNPSVPEMKYKIVDKVIPVEFSSESVTGPGSPKVGIIYSFSPAVENTGRNKRRSWMTAVMLLLDKILNYQSL